ncbi:HAMP domain-containing sensor histidine kinase [Burkholderia sp. Ac-20353]|uniref:sensor histidine kinase n=1 Tax=Burkholderia sp. Ac-20353 TaxID=2703894 RepID=UPI00197B83A7|nr:HAMP domain-containing sensor histidine kinase [Burkholderia sp. Ac-20353]MBN3790045.1 hypothetical protein [Burkholderia sp. Ac-20353]
MLTDELFDVLAFPFRVQDRASGRLLLASAQTLFDVPIYSKKHDSFWPTLKSEGWTRCPDGYGVFCCTLPSSPHIMLVIHGLKINGYSTAQGKSSGLSIKISSEQLEGYVRQFVSSIAKANTHFGTMLSESVHEIRGINTALYHSAYELSSSYDIAGKDAKLAKNITSLSELISERMNLIDFLASGEQRLDSFPLENIAVFKKFDKVVRCFMAFAARREIALRLSGSSHGTVRGNSLFELIPLLLLDNAVKYSPNNNDINVAFEEHADRISCSVSSVGPVVKPEERERIFEQSFRGEYAKKAGKLGSGIGLFFLKELVSLSGGSVAFAQDEHDLLLDRTVPHRRTRFSVEFPRSA